MTPPTREQCLKLAEDVPVALLDKPDDIIVWIYQRVWNEALSAAWVDCRQCDNRGKIFGLSQETYCEQCIYQGFSNKAGYFKLKVTP